jgi:hypothetical protein
VSRRVVESDVADECLVEYGIDDGAVRLAQFG